MRLLVIEDEPKIARGLKKGLEQEGFAVDIENDYENGFLAAQSIDYDMLIVDRMLPGGDGAELVQSLRKQELTTPALLLTALGQTRDIIEGLEHGADDYLTKPFEFEELLARIKALRRRPQSISSDDIDINGVVIDFSSRHVSINGDTINLSAKEFAVIECLARSKNRICNKEYLIEHVWDFDADILPNTVEVVVKNIRNKIDKPYKINFINTVRGKGYSIEV